MAQNIADALDVTGTLCIELFVIQNDDDYSLLVNELAPRPHNSGHVTIEACHTCQFAQHIRAVAGLPLGDSEPVLGAGAMINILGDLWADGEPKWSAAMQAAPRLKIHLYGKAAAAPGRKMGHMTLAHDDADEAVAQLRAAKELLTK